MSLGADYEPDAFSFIEEFQYRALGLMVQDSTWLLGFRDAVDARFWEHAVHRDIAALILAHFDLYGTPPDLIELVEAVETFLGENRDRAKAESKYEEALLDLFDQDLGTQDALTEKVVRFGKHQAMKAAAMKVVELLPTEDYDEMEPVFLAALRVGSDQRISGVDYAEGYAAVARRSFASYRKPVPTGVSALDNRMGGGLGRSEGGMIIAPTGRGKTLLQVDFAAGALLSGHHVYYATLEEPKWKIIERLNRRITGRTRSQIEGDPDQAIAVIDRLLKVCSGKISINYFAPGEIRLREIFDAIRRREDESGRRVDVVMLDYLDKVTPVKSRNSHVEELKELSEGWAAYLARDGAERAGWTGSQVNTEGEKAKVVRRHHAYGGRIKTHPMAVVITVSQTLKELSAQPLQIVRLLLDKNRDHGGGKPMPFRMDGARGCIVSDFDSEDVS